MLPALRSQPAAYAVLVEEENLFAARDVADLCNGHTSKFFWNSLGAGRSEQQLVIVSSVQRELEIDFLLRLMEAGARNGFGLDLRSDA